LQTHEIDTLPLKFHSVLQFESPAAVFSWSVRITDNFLKALYNKPSKMVSYRKQIARHYSWSTL